jgi:purine nucleoside permease
MRFALAALVVVAIIAGCTVPPPPVAEPQADVSPKVIVIAMFENGELWPPDFPGEGGLWAEREELSIRYPVSGAPWDLYCNEIDLCLIVTNMGTANATASILAVGLDPSIDTSQTYWMVAGIAGTPPEIGTTGSGAWAEWVVNADLSHHVNATEMPAEWDYPFIPLGCSDQWCDDGWKAGTEFYQLNAELTRWAYELSKDVELADNEDAQAYRANFPAELPGSQPPQVLICDSLDGDMYWHGVADSQWATWWVDKWTEGRGTYCMTNMEDSGTLTALTRLAAEGLADLDRVMVLRTASNFDQPYPGMTAQQSLAGSSGGFMPSIENAYRIGIPVASHIIDNWSEWVNGVPAAQ